ncbi:MAG: energy transducer TonB [Chromatiales bacterium]|jgi:protein TonB|nr:energy transducer TonB [Chromatiales bacterium]
MNVAALTRYAIAFVAATVVTFGLIWTMQVLIATGKQALTKNQEFKFVDFVRVKRDETVNQEEDKPEKPPEPDTPPPDAPPPQMDNVDTSQAVTMTPLSGSISVQNQLGGFQIVDGDYLPIVKVAPIYPRRAMTRGVEGDCLIEYTVTTSGAVRDPTVVECSSSLFARASLNAVLRFKYKPRVVDGNPIEVPGVRHVITYKLED